MSEMKRYTVLYGSIDGGNGLIITEVPIGVVESCKPALLFDARWKKHDGLISSFQEALDGWTNPRRNRDIEQVKQSNAACWEAVRDGSSVYNDEAEDGHGLMILVAEDEDKSYDPRHDILLGICRHASELEGCTNICWSDVAKGASFDAGKVDQYI